MKKFVALLLAMLMVFGLVACGSDEGTTTDTSSNNTTNETADKGDAEQAETSGETSAPSGDFTPADEIEYPQGKNIYSKPADIVSALENCDGYGADQSLWCSSPEGPGICKERAG